mmetsp:Transcript_85985/g.257647  ORF Transcript_85985/g.257647 Transcript_85985/m.257647 type:complete len:122 (+) Transcript_85985:4544-4909(+)
MHDSVQRQCADEAQCGIILRSVRNPCTHTEDLGSLMRNLSSRKTPPQSLKVRLKLVFFTACSPSVVLGRQADFLTTLRSHILKLKRGKDGLEGFLTGEIKEFVDCVANTTFCTVCKLIVCL